MVSARTNIVAAALAVSTFVAHVNAHGYMLIPETQFSGSATSAWVVQIDPPSGFESSDWDGNEEASVTTWKSLASKNGVTDLKTLLDGDTSLYGAECGFSDPNGTPQPIPSTSTATFSRAIQHVGPCEIWLDSTKVFSADNCYGTYDSDGTTVFPVDYSQCDSGGCSEMRFYWLAFQGVDGETVWQTYKDCIPLEGGSSTSTSTTSTTSTTSSTASDADTSSTPSTSAPSTSTSSDTSDKTSSENNDDTSDNTSSENNDNTSDNTSSENNDDTSSETSDDDSSKNSDDDSSKNSDDDSSKNSGDDSSKSWDASSKMASGSNGWGNWGKWGGRQLRA